MNDTIQIRTGKPDEVIDLRQEILRFGLPRESAIFDGDDEATTLHVVADRAGEIVGCATFLQRPWGITNEQAWQLRGMAVAEGLQGAGIGGRLLVHAEENIRAVRFSTLLWCNARQPALRFYERHGWQAWGNAFDVPTAGPHFKMWKRMSA